MTEPITNWKATLLAVAKHAEDLTRKWPLESGAYITPEELRRLAENPGSQLTEHVRKAVAQARDLEAEETEMLIARLYECAAAGGFVRLADDANAWLAKRGK